MALTKKQASKVADLAARYMKTKRGKEWGRSVEHTEAYLTEIVEGMRRYTRRHKAARKRVEWCDPFWYVTVERVSRSGMSRTLTIRHIEKGHSWGRECLDVLYWLAGCDVRNRISGCGMDMAFAAINNIACSLGYHSNNSVAQRYC